MCCRADEGLRCWWGDGLRSSSEVNEAIGGQMELNGKPEGIW